MSEFKVGEIVTVIWTIDGDGAGDEAEIVGEIEEMDGKPVHNVKFADGRFAHMEPKYLRKKQPPQELSSWEAIQKETGWHPNKVEA